MVDVGFSLVLHRILYNIHFKGAMAEFLVTVQDESKSRFIATLLKEFDYVKVKRRRPLAQKLSSEDSRILNSIEEAVEEVNLAKRGKVVMQDASDYIAELKREGYL